MLWLSSSWDLNSAYVGLLEALSGPTSKSQTRVSSLRVSCIPREMRCSPCPLQEPLTLDHGEHGDTPKIQKLRFQVFPELVQSEWELLDLCSKSEHLVESRLTGETFLVKWYTKRCIRWKGRMLTQRFMVFKIDEDGNVVFTSDIGDLCIFLSEAEPFCVRAPKSPNCVFFLGHDYSGVVNLHDYYPSINCSTYYPVPYYIPPQTPPKLAYY